MRKLIISAIVSMLFVLSFSFAAYAAGAMPQSIDAVMSGIRQEQGLKSDGIIDIHKVSTSRLEILGSAVMDAVVSDTAVHARMDKDMGKNSAAKLNDFHKSIGYNYLADYPNGLMNLMSAGVGSSGSPVFDSFGLGGLVMGVLCMVLLRFGGR